MTAKVTIVLDQANDVPTVPSSALGTAQADGSYRLSVVDANGQVEQRTVTVGLNNKVTAQIDSGLAVGDRIVARSSATATPVATASKTGGAGGPPMGMGL